jgi:TPR repeat protein
MDNGEFAGVERSLKAALPWYGEALRRYENEPAPCFALVLMYGYGLEVWTHLPAARALSQCCLDGFSQACHFSGRVYERGEGVKASLTQALAWYERGCQSLLDEACVSAALVHRRVGRRQRARTLLEAACFQMDSLCETCDADAKYWRADAHACQALASLIRQQAPLGEADRAHAAHACERFAHACARHTDDCARNAERCAINWRDREIRQACEGPC